METTDFLENDSGPGVMISFSPHYDIPKDVKDNLVLELGMAFASKYGEALARKIWTQKAFWNWFTRVFNICDVQHDARMKLYTQKPYDTRAQAVKYYEAAMKYRISKFHMPEIIRRDIFKTIKINQVCHN